MPKSMLGAHHMGLGKMRSQRQEAMEIRNNRMCVAAFFFPQLKYGTKETYRFN